MVETQRRNTSSIR